MRLAGLVLLSRAVTRAEALLGAGELEAAEALFRDAVAQDPEDLLAAKGLAQALDRMRRFDEAFDAWETTLRIAPDDVICQYALGDAWQRRGDVERSRKIFERIRDAHPNFYPAYAMTLLSMLYSDKASAVEIKSEQQRWGRFHTPSPESVFDCYKGSAEPERRIRIGFVSSDLHAHSIGFNLLPLYVGLDRAQFSVHSYTQSRLEDSLTAKFRDLSDGWRDILGVNDHDAARVIHDDGIDILVFVAGHFDENRPFIARYRPAPIQISHHDLCTSAMPEMDYLIGDAIGTPRHGIEYHSERVLRMPSFTIHPIPAEAPPPASPPMVESGFVTFGSFNAPQKITPGVVRVWAKILQAIPDARLILKYFDAYDESATRRRMRDLFDDHGIERGRVDLLPASSTRAVHLNAYSRMDIALDPFPFCGATTTFEALIMGVPVIALTGERYAGRSSTATLMATGLSVCVAENEADYIARAVELARAPERLQPLRQALPNMVRNSRVCNMGRYVRNFQRLYRAVWRRWCVHQPGDGSEISHQTGV